MKRRLLLQILFLLLLLFAWNIGHYVYQLQKNVYHSGLESLPLIVYCQDYTQTDSLATELKAKHYVSSVEVDDHKKIAEIFIQEYGLEEAEEILKIHSLPYVIQVYFQGEQFGTSEKADLRDLLLENQEQISWQYNDAYWTHYNNRLKLLNDAYFYVNVLLALIIFVFAVYFRVRSEEKLNDYWNIYKEAGGSANKREKVFWFHSLLVLIIPLGMNLGAYFYFQDVLSFPIETVYFLYQAALLVAISLFSRLLLWKRL